MSRYLIFIITLLITQAGYSKCKDRSIWCANNSKYLNKNGRIILEFRGYCEEYVPKLNSQYLLYLKSNEEKVSVDIIETNKGDHRITQIVLKPTQTLKPGIEYFLHLEKQHLKDLRDSVFWMMEKRSNSFDSIPFIASDIIDNTAPIITREPFFITKIYEQNMCPKQNYIKFGIEGKDDSEFFVLTKVKDVKTNKVTSFILRIYNNEVTVGDDECAAEFDFINGDSFEVVFQLIDQSGNLSEPTKPYTFFNPAIPEAKPEKTSDKSPIAKPAKKMKTKKTKKKN